MTTKARKTVGSGPAAGGARADIDTKAAGGAGSSGAGKGAAAAQRRGSSKAGKAGAPARVAQGPDPGARTPAPASPPAASRSARPSKAAPAPKTRKAKGGSVVGDAKGATASPVKGEEDHFLAEQRELLVSERATYEEQAQSLRAEADSLAQEMEPGDVQFDEESGEGGTVTVDRERDLALSAQALAAVEEIDRALAKLGAGTYGTCERCHQPIPRARLEAVPHATLCVPCKSGGLSRR